MSMPFLAEVLLFPKILIDSYPLSRTQFVYPLWIPPRRCNLNRSPSQSAKYSGLRLSYAALFTGSIQSIYSSARCIDCMNGSVSVHDSRSLECTSVEKHAFGRLSRARSVKRSMYCREPYVDTRGGSLSSAFSYVCEQRGDAVECHGQPVSAIIPAIHTQSSPHSQKGTTCTELLEEIP
eukprot:gb/GECG01009720.1/.p1 GENE.gb/GECG01009720.1/~~gb/GECG01009720.1/.p1  ORF type:complete len:179 (+),score=10.23 gb/GECG01009720.1/:1-537(+)